MEYKTEEWLLNIVVDTAVTADTNTVQTQFTHLNIHCMNHYIIQNFQGEQIYRRQRYSAWTKKKLHSSHRNA